MKNSLDYGWVLLGTVLFLLAAGTSASWGQSVVDVEPSENSITAEAAGDLEIEFDGAVDAAVIADDIQVFGTRSGACAGEVENIDPSTVRFSPVCPFWENEVVTATVTDDGAVDEPFSWQFTIRTEHGSGELTPRQPETIGSESLDAMAADTVEADAAGTFVLPATPYAGELENNITTDVAVVNQEQNELVVLFNEGDGEFEELSLDAPDGVSPTGVVGGDVTGNELPDLITFNNLDNTLSIYANEGGRSFSDPDVVDTGSRPIDVAIGDLNGNGALDLAVSAFGADEVWLHFNDGAGNFTASNPEERLDVGSAPVSIEARDMDRSAALDLVVASAGDERVEYLQNEGNGDFTLNGAFDLPFSPGVLVANDVLGNDETYGDGWIDLVVSDRNEGRVVAYAHDGDPDTFSFDEVSEVDVSAPALSMVLADVETDAPVVDQPGDGTGYTLDLITTHLSSGAINLIQNEANQQFGSPTGLEGDLDDPAGVVALDLGPRDEDDTARTGDQDVVVFNASGTKFQVFENVGSGRESPIAVEADQLTDCEECVGESETKTIQIENVTVYPIEVFPTLENGEAFSIDEGLIGLEPGETTEIEITFEPEEPTDYEDLLGLAVEELTEFCGDVSNRTSVVPIPLAGTGLDSELAVEPDAIDFGMVTIPDSETESFQIINDGNITADVEAFEEPEDPPFEISAADEPGAIAGPSEQTVQVTFAPEEESTYTDEVRIETEDECGSDELIVTLDAEAEPRLPNLFVELDNLPDGELLIGDERSFDVVVTVEDAPVEDPFETAFELTRPDGVTEPAGEETIESLAEGETRELETDLVTFNQEGNYEICAIADANDDVETGERSELEACEVIPVREPLPDLVAEELEPVDGEDPLDDLKVGQERDFECTFSNQGDIPAEGPFEVGIFRDGLEIERTEISELEVGERETFAPVPVNFPDEGSIELACEVDRGNQVDELTLDNNEIVRTITVDVQDELVVQPNPFTPNDDGFDDVVQFEVTEFGLSAPEVRIFSFEGQHIRTLDEIRGGVIEWDGLDRNNQEQPPGVYVYVVRENGSQVASGHVTLAR